MPVQYRRVAVAAALTAVVAALPVAAFASGSPGTKPGHPQTTLKTPATPKTKAAAGASGSADPSQPSAALARSAGISQSRLDTGLTAAKRAGGRNAAGITAFAQAAGVSPATAQRIVDTVFGTGKQAGSKLTGPSSHK
jgi:hypothetical protein